MSSICILAPTIIASWPAISAAVAGAAASLGLTAMNEAKSMSLVTVAPKKSTVEVELQDSEVVSETLSTKEEMVFQKDDIQVRVYRDERGQCRVCVDSDVRSKEELRLFGEKVAGKITQIFVYNKIMTELKGRDFSVLKNEMSQDETVHIHVRRSVQ
jgi:hypothetical protein